MDHDFIADAQFWNGTNVLSILVALSDICMIMQLYMMAVGLPFYKGTVFVTFDGFFVVIPNKLTIELTLQFDCLIKTYIQDRNEMAFRS